MSYIVIIITLYSHFVYNHSFNSIGKMEMKVEEYKRIVMAIISVIILYITSKLMIESSGNNQSEINIILLMTLIIILSSSRKIFLFTAMPMTVIYALYSPIGLIFGKPTYQYIASIFSTDLLESKEFIMQIPKVNFLYPIIILLGVASYWVLIRRYEISLYKNKTIICILIIFSMINQAPAELFKNMIKSAKSVKSEMENLKSLRASSSWESNYENNLKYDNYILVIGESARMDYHHAYGYPINNTNFMSSSNGMLITGLTSGGTNTVSSLRLMLTKSNVKLWEPDYGLNFIDLVKSAGIKTYWLSNQGFIGKADTPVSAIAKRSDEKYFLKYADASSENTSDFSLIDKINYILDNNKKQKKLIVVHLYGSHNNACDRIDDYHSIINTNDERYNYINCYISSISKTDSVLNKINELLIKNKKSSNESYSILYFSDHGLSHYKIGDTFYMNHTGKTKSNFNIPLFVTSSDDTTRKECASFKSGLNFVDGIASWIGIKNKKLNAEYSLFDCKDDPDDYGLSDIIDKENYDSDPAIDITGK